MVSEVGIRRTPWNRFLVFPSENIGPSSLIFTAISRKSRRGSALEGSFFGFKSYHSSTCPSRRLQLIFQRPGSRRSMDRRVRGEWESDCARIVTES